MNNQAAFTIVEVLIVIAIFSIAAALAVSGYISQLPTIRLKAAARQIKTDMELAKLRAVRENGNVSVLFDTANNAYEIILDDGSGGGTAGNYIQDGTESRIKKVSMPDTVDLYQVTFSGNHTKFNGRGLPNILGSAYMKNSKDQYRGISLSIVGRIALKESNNSGSTWQEVE